MRTPGQRTAARDPAAHDIRHCNHNQQQCVTEALISHVTGKGGGGGAEKSGRQAGDESEKLTDLDVKKKKKKRERKGTEKKRKREKREKEEVGCKV